MILRSSSTIAKSKSHTGELRMHKDILDSRFVLTKVTRIENTDYKDSIFGKGADFTFKEHWDLIALGERQIIIISENNQVHLFSPSHHLENQFFDTRDLF